MTDVIEKLNEGDIYHWAYRDPNTDDRQWGSYHCCSRIAIVSRGLLRDTFWQIGQSFSDGRSFRAEDIKKLVLTFVANISDLEPAREYQADYYDDADIVNLNHSNSTSGNFYLRKGAARSRKKMFKVAIKNLEQSFADERRAVERTKDLRAIICRIDAGDLDVHIPTVFRR